MKSLLSTGSTDQTREIVKGYTDHVYDFIWINDFAAARNYSFSLAFQEYILWLDADDVLLSEDQERFRKLKASLDPAVDSVTMQYHLSKDENDRLMASLRRNRLVKRDITIPKKISSNRPSSGINSLQSLKSRMIAGGPSMRPAGPGCRISSFASVVTALIKKPLLIGTICRYFYSNDTRIVHNRNHFRTVLNLL